jgi:hypothetical protein
VKKKEEKRKNNCPLNLGISDKETIKLFSCWMYWDTPIIPALGRLRQEDSKTLSPTRQLVIFLIS